MHQTALGDFRSAAGDALPLDFTNADPSRARTSAFGAQDRMPALMRVRRLDGSRRELLLHV